MSILIRFLSIFLLMPAFGIGQQVWTIEDCLKRIEEQNLTLQQMRLNTQLANIDLKESKYSRLPDLRASGGADYSSGRNIDPTSNDFITDNIFSSNFNINSNIAIYNGGRINAQIRQNKINKEKANAQLLQSLNDVNLEAISLYLNVLYLEEIVKDARNQLNVSEESLENMRKMVSQGSLARNELLDLEAQHASEEKNLIEAINQFDLAQLRLKQIMRIANEEELILESPSIDNFEVEFLETYTVQSLFDHALKTQPFIRASELDVAAANERIKIAKSAYYPSLGGGVYIGSRYSDAAFRITGFDQVWEEFPLRLNGQQVDVEIQSQIPSGSEVIPFKDQVDQNLGYGLGVNLSIPIFNRLTTKSAVDRAKLSKRQAELDLELSKDRLQNDVETALTNAKAADKTYEANKKIYLARKSAFENAEKKVSVGSGTSFQLAQAKNELNIAQTNRLNAKYDLLFKIKVLDYYLGRPLTLN